MSWCPVIDAGHDLGQKARHDELDAQDHEENAENEVSQVLFDLPAEKVETHREQKGDQKSDSAEHEPDHAEELERTIDETDDELHRHEIENHAPDSGESVIGFSLQPDDVLNGDLDDLDAALADQGGYEPVEFP